ncbi:hypothetical protein J4G07_20195 [Candidatus Poribacteria bacterium]|nr:hypothetical protein [Candidatus Poribacteria bacterium]
MRQLNVRMLFVCFAALLFVVACADTAKKEAEEAPAQTAAPAIEEVTLAVKVQDALTKLTGVTEVVSVSMEENKAVVKIEKDKVEKDTLVKAVTDVGFSAQVAN